MRVVLYVPAVKLTAVTTWLTSQATRWQVDWEVDLLVWSISVELPDIMKLSAMCSDVGIDVMLIHRPSV